jgi:hypothetical protein
MQSRGTLPRSTTSITDPVELSLDDVTLNTWLEDTGEYLRLDVPERTPPAPIDAASTDPS